MKRREGASSKGLGTKLGVERVKERQGVIGSMQERWMKERNRAGESGRARAIQRATPRERWKEEESRESARKIGPEKGIESQRARRGERARVRESQRVNRLG